MISRRSILGLFAAAPVAAPAAAKAMLEPVAQPWRLYPYQEEALKLIRGEGSIGILRRANIGDVRSTPTKPRAYVHADEVDEYPEEGEFVYARFGRREPPPWFRGEIDVMLDSMNLASVG